LFDTLLTSKAFLVKVLVLKDKIRLIWRYALGAFRAILCLLLGKTFNAIRLLSLVRVNALTD
jgi:hypothetical protein